MNQIPFIKLPNGEMIRADMIVSVRIEDEKSVIVNGKESNRQKCHIAVDFQPPLTIPKTTYLEFESILERDKALILITSAMEAADIIILSSEETPTESQ